MVTSPRAVGRMVFNTVPLGWLKRPFAVLHRDLREWWTMARARSACRPGLFTYYVHPPGGRRRIHLRIGSDGSGVLLIDAVDVIHLNSSAAFLIKYALEGYPRKQAVAAMKLRFAGINTADISRHAHKMYALVQHLATTTNACPTCGLQSLDQTALFSAPVNVPYKADLALCYGCNNSCPHCYNRAESTLEKSPPRAPTGTGRSLVDWSGEGQGEDLSLSQWKTVLRKLARLGVPHVIFTGGEPTLFSGLVGLIREGERLGLITGLNTNGRRLADRAFVHALAQAGLSHVQITLQSCRAQVHNAMSGAESFLETCQGVTNALDAGLHAITNTTLTRQNIDHALQTVDFLRQLGLRAFAMNGMIFSGRGLLSGDAVPAEELASILAAVRDRATDLGMRFLWYTPTEYCRLSPLELELGPRRCNAGEYSVCIEPNGDVLPCQSYYMAAGNILRDPWQSIWESDLFHSFRDRAHDPRSSGLPQRCWQCPDLRVCGGGCRLEREKVDSQPCIVLTEQCGR